MAAKNRKHPDPRAERKSRELVDRYYDNPWPEPGQWGPVFIADGPWEGRFGWYDGDDVDEVNDDSGEERAIVYLDPGPGEEDGYVFVDYEFMRTVPAEDLPAWLRVLDPQFHTPIGVVRAIRANKEGGERKAPLGASSSTMQNAFYPSEIRLRWAAQKLDELEMCVTRAAQDALGACARETSDDRMAMLFEFNRSVTGGARRRVSEYALHARAALDYLVFTLAELNTGREQDHTQFPICDVPAKFPKKRDGSGTDSLRHLTTEQVALVEQFQPCKGFPLLEVLHKLSNRDKHREFVHISAFGTTAPTSGSPTGAAVTASQLNANFHRSLEIVLPDGNNALQTLRALQAELRTIVDRFNSLLASKGRS